MSRQSLWKISITTSAEAEDAVANWLSEAFENDANIHHDFRSGKIVVSVFTENKPPSAIRARWREKRAQLKSFSINPGAGTLRIESVRRENWAESWKRHFKPIEIGDALLVKPSWIKRKTKRGQALVVLDPGLSFGTGQHPTTSFCLRELTRRRNAAQPQSFLDIGTGSGILAIAATKLGYAPVHAFDFDAESVRVARANAKRNRIADKISLARKDLTKLPRATPRRYDVVCANLISTLLISKRERIANRIKPNGLLIVAGILKSEFHLVQNAFEEIGFRLAARKQEKEWCSGAFARAAQG